MGYQCEHSPARVHHLFTGLHTLEILDTDGDRPVRGTQPGRLVFTAHTRRGQRLDRYEIGDLGRWVPGDCPCGRRTPRFELLGRIGDVFRIGAQTMNHRRFVAAAEDGFGYAGALQLVLSEHIEAEQLTILLEQGKAPDLARAERAFLSHYSELSEGVEHDRLIRLRIESVPLDEFHRTATSGKLISVVDRRGRAL
jgi:phenylacetate-coenzyme A ligase PaaK-like adenylate-forming protein